MLLPSVFIGGSRISRTGGVKVGRHPIIWPDFSENCMKMKEIGPRGRLWHPLRCTKGFTGCSQPKEQHQVDKLKRCVSTKRWRPVTDNRLNLLSSMWMKPEEMRGWNPMADIPRRSSAVWSFIGLLTFPGPHLSLQSKCKIFPPYRYCSLLTEFYCWYFNIPCCVNSFLYIENVFYSVTCCNNWKLCQWLFLRLDNTL